MPDDKDVGPSARDCGEQATILPVVCDEDPGPREVELEELRQREKPRAAVVAPAHGVERSDLSQAVEERLVDGVAGEHDAVNAPQDLRQQRVEAAVQIGNETDPHRPPATA